METQAIEDDSNADDEDMFSAETQALLSDERAGKDKEPEVKAKEKENNHGQSIWDNDDADEDLFLADTQILNDSKESIEKGKSNPTENHDKSDQDLNTSNISENLFIEEDKNEEESEENPVNPMLTSSPLHDDTRSDLDESFGEADTQLVEPAASQEDQFHSDSELAQDKQEDKNEEDLDDTRILETSDNDLNVLDGETESNDNGTSTTGGTSAVMSGLNVTNLASQPMELTGSVVLKDEDSELNQGTVDGSKEETANNKKNDSSSGDKKPDDDKEQDTLVLEDEGLKGIDETSLETVSKEEEEEKEQSEDNDDDDNDDDRNPLVLPSTQLLVEEMSKDKASNKTDEHANQEEEPEFEEPEFPISTKKISTPCFDDDNEDVSSEDEAKLVIDEGRSKSSFGPGQENATEKTPKSPDLGDSASSDIRRSSRQVKRTSRLLENYDNSPSMSRKPNKKKDHVEEPLPTAGPEVQKEEHAVIDALPHTPLKQAVTALPPPPVSTPERKSKPIPKHSPTKPKGRKKLATTASLPSSLLVQQPLKKHVASPSDVKLDLSAISLPQTPLPVQEVFPSSSKLTIASLSTSSPFSSPSRPTPPQPVPSMHMLSPSPAAQLPTSPVLNVQHILSTLTPVKPASLSSSPGGSKKKKATTVRSTPKKSRKKLIVDASPTNASPAISIVASAAASSTQVPSMQAVQPNESPSGEGSKISKTTIGSTKQGQVEKELVIPKAAAEQQSSNIGDSTTQKSDSKTEKNVQKSRSKKQEKVERKPRGTEDSTGKVSNEHPENVPNEKPTSSTRASTRVSRKTPAHLMENVEQPSPSKNQNVSHANTKAKKPTKAKSPVKTESPSAKVTPPKGKRASRTAAAPAVLAVPAATKRTSRSSRRVSAAKKVPEAQPEEVVEQKGAAKQTRPSRKRSAVSQDTPQQTARGERKRIGTPSSSASGKGQAPPTKKTRLTKQEEQTDQPEEVSKGKGQNKRKKSASGTGDSAKKQKKSSEKEDANATSVSPVNMSKQSKTRSVRGFRGPQVEEIDTSSTPSSRSTRSQAVQQKDLTPAAEPARNKRSLKQEAPKGKGIKTPAESQSPAIQRSTRRSTQNVRSASPKKLSRRVSVICFFFLDPVKRIRGT